MARIVSRKVGNGATRRGRVRNEMTGSIMAPMGIVFSAGALILNLTDDERDWTLILSDAETEAVAARFREIAARAALSKAKGETE